MSALYRLLKEKHCSFSRTAFKNSLHFSTGFEIASTIRCPDVLNGIFDVAFENGDGNNTNDIEMDSCIDVKRMVFTNLSPKSTHGFTSKNLLKRKRFKKYQCW